jgi:hypothetical protein
MKLSTRKAPGEKARLLEKFARRFVETPTAQRRDAGVAIRKEMLEGMSTNSLETQKNYIRDLRKVIKEICLDVDKDDLPGCPRELVKKVKANAATKLQARTNDKMLIDSDMLIEMMVQGMIDGRDRDQVPQVLFCANYIVALRANDLNTQKKRADGTSSCPDDYQYVKGVTIGDGDREVAGTINNLKPSKENTDKRFVKGYATVLICKPSDYDTVIDILAWAMDSSNASRPCTTTVNQYNRGDASGAEVKGQEWGKGGGGIIPVMVKRLGLDKAVKEWGFNKSGLTKQLGRSFVASCVEQGRLELDRGLTSSQAVELVLGHAPGSMNNNDYLKVDCRPCTAVAGVVAVKVCEDHPIGDVKYGLCLVKK